VLQRIQTLYLIVTILLSVALYFTSQDVEVLGSNSVISMVACGSLLLSLISIFSYKNRPRQVLFNRLNIFINALLIGLLVYWMLNLPGGISIPEKGIEFIFPLIALVMFVFANIHIQKDEKLVKSVDRLR
jgi:peptidoglycan/LPS O-acetylase OafA/YrhL